MDGDSLSHSHYCVLAVDESEVRDSAEGGVEAYYSGASTAVIISSEGADVASASDGVHVADGVSPSVAGDYSEAAVRAVSDSHVLVPSGTRYASSSYGGGAADDVDARSTDSAEVEYPDSSSSPSLPRRSPSTVIAKDTGESVQVIEAVSSVLASTGEDVVDSVTPFLEEEVQAEARRRVLEESYSELLAECEAYGPISMSEGDPSP